MIQYQKIYKLEITHEYHEDSEVYLDLVPTAGTVQLLKKHGIKIKRNANSYDFYKEASAVENLESWSLNENLNFSLVLVDPEFFNYTDLPFVDSFTESLFSDSSSISTVQVLPHYSSPLVIRVDSNDEKLEIKDNQGNTVTSFSAQELGNETLSVNLFSCEEGVYDVWKNDQLDHQFLLLKDPQIRREFGRFHLSNFSVNGASELKFNSKNCAWVYELILSEKDKMKEFELTINHDQIDFEKVESRDSDADSPLRFESTSAFPIKKKITNHPECSLRYTLEHSEIEEVLKIKLPVPSAKNIQLTADKKNIAISIVYL